MDFLFSHNPHHVYKKEECFFLKKIKMNNYKKIIFKFNSLKLKSSWKTSDLDTEQAIAFFEIGKI